MILPINNTYKYNQQISFKSNKPHHSKHRNENFSYADSFVYRNGDSYTDPEIKTALSDIEYAYYIINNMLEMKTSAGKKSLIQESNMFNLIDGLTLKNIDKDGTQYTISKPEKTNIPNSIRITQKNRNNEIINDWLFSSYKLIKESTPSQTVFCNKKETETIKTTQNLPNKLQKIDEALFKLRMFIDLRKDKDLIPPAGILNTDTQNLLAQISNNTKNVENKFKTMSHSSVMRQKNKYPNYYLSGQNTYTFQNLSEENIKINFNKYNSASHGQLTRLLVYDKNDNIIDGFLLKDNKIVSNFMLNNPSILPKKLSFISKDEITNDENETKLNKYLKLYNEELESFLKYLNNWQNYNGTMPEKQKKEFINANQSYINILNIFENLNNLQIAQYKKDYPKLKTGTNIKGFMFKNVDKKGNSINYVKVKNKHHDNLYRLNIIDQNNDIVKVLLIKDNEKIVSNLNMTYPEIVPKILKFYKEEEIEKMDGLELITLLQDNMQELENYVKNRFNNEQEQKQEIVLTKQKRAEKKNSIEYKNLIKQAKQNFKNAIEIADIHPQDFFKTLETIKKDFENYFESIQNQ